MCDETNINVNSQDNNADEKEVKVKRHKKKGKKKALKVLICIAVVIVCLGAIIAITNTFIVKSNIEFAESFEKVKMENQLVPQKDESGDWVFTTDEDFKVMHLTDIHQGGGFLCKGKDRKSLTAVAAMITAEKPDLVIVTGDIAYPVPYQAGTFNNKSGAKQFAALMESLGVYWTVTFGNHDTESYSYFNREKISAFYSDENLKYCLYEAGLEDVDGYGNHIIKVKNSQNIISQAFVMLDSHSYTDGDILGIAWKYDNIHDNQVEWYKNEIIAMNKANEAAVKVLKAENEAELLAKYTPVKSTAYFHIPLVEARDAWLELEANNFESTDSAEYIDGIIGETGKRIFCGIGEDALFEAMIELGSTKAMFNGHDHYNNATFSKNDIIFSYGYSIDYLAYGGISGEGSQRGCTVITCKPDCSIEINKYNYYSEKYILEGYTREDVTMQFEDVTYQVPQKD